MIDRAWTGHSPAWSPDSTKIAFVGGYEPPFAQVCVMDADGSNQTNLTNHHSRHEDPAWAPDGNRIAFVRPAAGASGSGLYTMEANGSRQRLLCNDSTSSRPAWSPDGSKIAVTTYVLQKGSFI